MTTTPRTDTEYTLSIDGMSCAACAARIEKVCNRLPGVTLSVNFATETAHLDLTSEETSFEKVLATIQKAGFEAHPHQPKQKDAQAQQLKAQAKAFWLAALFSAPLALQMPAMLWGQAEHGHLLPLWLQWLLATPVQFYFGARFYKGAWASLKSGSANMDVLVALGTSMAYGLSVWTTLFNPTHHAVYFEASAMIITLILLGKYLEYRAKTQTHAALEALAQLQPQTARVLEGQTLKVIPIHALSKGMRFVVLPGDSIPVDGTVEAGESYIEEAMLTGESAPVHKQAGASVFAGTQNQSGRLECLATGVGRTTLLAQIIRWVEEAQNAKAPIQQLADRVSAIFVPSVLLLAALTGVLWFVNGQTAETAILHAVAVLVIACPCALGLATPTAILVGSTQAARNGLLVRNASALERTEKLTVLALDKTGTLTQGLAQVTQHCSVPGLQISPEQAHDIAALAQQSSHPLSVAVFQYLKTQWPQMEARPAPALSQFESHPAKGLSAKLNGHALRLGSLDFVLENAPAPTWLEAALKEAQSLVAVSLDGALLMLFSIADPIRPEAALAIQALQEKGVEVVMLTGDTPAVAQAVANTLGIQTWHAQLLPQDKTRLIQNLQQKGHVVGMVGDGINDAPALAQADISFALGAGTDIARKTADMTLIRNDLRGIPEAISLSRATLKTIRQNLFFAFIYNIIGIPLAALGLLNPVIAALAMAASSVSVITNALRLRGWKP